MAYAWQKDPSAELSKLLYQYPEEFLKEFHKGCYQSIESSTGPIFDTKTRLGTEKFGIQTWRSEYFNQINIQAIYQSEMFWKNPKGQGYRVLNRMATNWAADWKRLAPGEGLLIRLDYADTIPPPKEALWAFKQARNMQLSIIDFLQDNGWVVRTIGERATFILPKEACKNCQYVIPCKLTYL